MADHDILVVGGGVIGCSVARELADEFEVLLLEANGIAGGATGRSAGLVAPTLFYGDLPAVARTANRFFREFDGTDAFSFTRRDRLDLVVPADESDSRATARRLADEGFPVEYLPAAAVEERYPAFDLDGFAGAVEYRDTGWVDPYSLTTALAADARRRGATVRSDTPVTGFEVEDGSVVGVRTGDDVIPAEAVVVTAGWRSADMLGDFAAVPVRPYRTQCVVLSPTRALSDDFPLVRIGSEGLYLRPEHNGDLLVGGGFHQTDAPMDASERADESFRMAVSEAVPDLLPGLGGAGFVDGWAGIDGGTPDTRPVIDSLAEPEGVVVAAGFNGLGVMVSPAAAVAVRELVGGEPAPFALDPFAIDRFDAPPEGFEMTSTSDI